MTKHHISRRAWPLLLILLFLAAAKMTGCSLSLFWSRKSHLSDILTQMFPPDWSYAGRIVMPLLTTIQMSVTGTFLGALLALFASPFCAGNLDSPGLVRSLLRILVQILRSFPALILALLATFLFGLGTFAGTWAIFLYTFAIMTRLTYEDIENTVPGPYRALSSMGISPAKAFFRAVFPEIAPSYFTNALYLLETNVRHSSILGYVGAGGIGLLLNEKMSWLEYGRVGMILVLLFFAVLAIETLSRLLTGLIQKERSMNPACQKAAVLLTIVLFLFCALTTAPPDFSHTSLRTLQNMILGLLRPDWAFFFSMKEDGLLFLLLETVSIAFVGTVAGACIAAPLSFLSTGKIVPSPVAAVFRLVIVAVRSVPFFIYGLIFIRVSGPGAFTGVLTLAVCSVGLLCKRFTESLEALDFKPRQALAAMGVSPVLSIRHAILPQLKPAFFSAVLYRFDVNIREASVLGLVGAGGIGAPLIFAMNKYAWDRAGAIALGLVLLVWLIDLLSGRLRKTT